LNGFCLFLPSIFKKIAPPLLRVGRNSLKFFAKSVKRRARSAQKCFPRKTQIVKQSDLGKSLYPNVHRWQEKTGEQSRELSRIKIPTVKA
jgi:hypothetical protein